MAKKKQLPEAAAKNETLTPGETVEAKLLARKMLNRRQFPADGNITSKEHMYDLMKATQASTTEGINHIIACSTAGESATSTEIAGKNLNRAIGQLLDLAPQNHLESMLMSQMIQVQGAAAKCLNLALMNDQTSHGIGLYGNLAVKFQRTFVAQIEALQKLRSTGQHVRVEHVHVHDGGQAIVGTVNHAAGGEGNNEG